MIDLLTQILWIIASLVIFGSGMYFCFKLRFIHLNFRCMLNAIKEKAKNENSISSFQALAMALAGRIGVGSLAGIALAVFIAGPGVLFWIWLTSLICATNTFVESALAVKFRQKDEGNIYRGGPFYYIRDGLKKNKIALLYAIIILIAYIGGFLTIQVNTIGKCLSSLININPLIIGFAIAILTGLTIFGGVKKIASTTSKMVPIMTIFYFAVCLFIIISNYKYIIPILKNIFNSSLNFKTGSTGIITTLILGMQKGIFSSEVGLGTGAIAAVTADATPCNSGLVQTFGIHIENLLIATITVLVISMASFQNFIPNDLNGIEITIHAFKYHLGNFGVLFVAIAITLFGLATILTGYYYGESSLKFIKKTDTVDIYILKIITLILLVAGSIISSNLLWILIDIIVGIIAIINIWAIFSLRKTL